METTLTLNVHYLVNGAGDPSGGAISIVPAPVVGATIVILRRTVRSQDTLYVPNDPFPAASHEAALDKLTMIVQEDADELTRAMLVAEADSARGQMILPPVPERAGKYLGFDGLGRPVALSGGGGEGGGGGEFPGGPTDTDEIVYQGERLTEVLQNTIEQLAITGDELALQGLKNINQDQTLAVANGRLTTLGEAVQDLDSRYDTVIAAIEAMGELGGDVAGLLTVMAIETLARVDGDQAMVDTVSLIGARSADSTAFILNLDTVQVDPDTSLSQRLTFLDSEIGDLSSRITTEQEARVDGDAAEAAQRALQVSALGDDVAQVQTEIATLASANVVAAQNFTLLGARNGAGTAWNLSLASVMVSEGESLGTRLSGITSALAGNSAAVAEEASARATADGALATAITTVNTTVGDLSASVTTLASSIGGIGTMWGVALDVNGYISGISQNNSGDLADFIVRADKFAVVMPGNPSRPVFEVTAGYVRIAGRLLVDDLLGGTLNADVLMGSGRIVFNNGVTMRVQGTGFGTVNQFVDWFGPTLANVNLCAESNATFYLRKDGAAYFGGSLHAGTLTTRAATSSLSPTAEVTTAVFGSNGNTITVIASYAYESGNYTVYNADSAGLGQFNGRVSAYGATSEDGELFSGSTTISGNITVQLWRSIGGAGMVHVDTFTLTQGTAYFSGLKPQPGDAAGWGRETYVYTVSRTYTDPDNSPANRQFRAVMLGRTASALGSPSQRLSIVASE